MKIHIFTSVVNRVDFVIIQNKLFQKFLSDAQRFFDSVKYDLARLQGVPDLNRAPSTYHPLRIV